MEELIPGCVTVPVKYGTSRLSALTHAPEKAREMIREGAELAMSRIDETQPLKLQAPILFRDQRVEATFDEENPPKHSRVIDAHTREIEGEDIVDLMHKIYSGYPRNWKPLDWEPEQ